MTTTSRLLAIAGLLLATWPSVFSDERELGVAIDFLATTLAAQTQTATKSEFSLQASVWDYESLCSFGDPPNWPPRDGTIAAAAKIDLSPKPCSELQAAYGHPSVIVVRATGSAAGEISLKLENVSAKQKDGTEVRPAAYRWVTQSVSPGSGTRIVNVWSTSLRGTWIVNLPKSVPVDLLFIFEKVELGDVVSIEGLGRIPIRKSLISKE